MKASLGTVVIVLVLIAIPVGIVWFNYATYRAWKTLSDLEEKGVLTEGKVLGKDESHGPRRVDEYYIEYSYIATMPDGSQKEFSSKASVDENTHYLAYEGDPIEIIYQKEDPSVSDVKGNDDITTRIVLTIILDIIIVIAIVWIVLQAMKGKEG